MCIATPSSDSVSVVIPTFNRAFCIRSAIDAVLAQSQAADEIIIVDDGSTDDTAHILESYGKRISYVYQKNAGVSAARNAGVKKARGRWIAFLDSDDEWHPHKLELQLAEVKANPSVIAHFVDCKIHETGGRDRSIFEVRGRLKDFSGSPLRDRPLLDVLTSVFFPSAWMVQREVILKAGGFDENIVVCEDTDLLSRIAVLGPFIVSCFQGTFLERRDASGGLSDWYEKCPQRYFESMRHTYQWLTNCQNISRPERHFILKELAAIHVELALLHSKEGRMQQMRHELVCALLSSFHPRNLVKVVALHVLGYRRYCALVEHSGRRKNVYRRDSMVQGHAR